MIERLISLFFCFSLKKVQKKVVFSSKKVYLCGGKSFEKV